jgi:peptide/nickel transport system substrate-binding protein
LEPLARYDETARLVPYLASEIPTLDNGGIAQDLMSVTWKLKPGILWSDGTPFTAEDVVFTAEYCLNPDMGCNALNNYGDIESVVAVDDLTVQVNFTVPKPFPYGAFVGAATPIVAQECTEENFGPIGTGPYMVKEFRANDVVTYEVNPNYRDPNKPFFSEVIFKGGGDATSAARAVLETGEADYAWNLQVDPNVLRQMEGAGLGEVMVSFDTGVERLMVNFTDPNPDLGDNRSKWTPDNQFPHPFLSDINVRKALSLAIDRGIIAQVGYGGGFTGQATCNVLAQPPIYASTANNDCLAQDVAQANQLLDDAGWLPGPDGIREKDGVRLSILYQTSTNQVRQGTQALVKQMWEAIGVETELRNIDSAVFFGGDPASPDTYGKFYSDIEMYTNTFDGTDPEFYLRNWRTDEISDESNQWLGGNIPRWYSEEYDALTDQMAGTADFDARVELAKQMNDMLMQNYVMIPLVDRASVSGRLNTLLGVRMNGWDSELWNIADWSRASQ